MAQDQHFGGLPCLPAPGSAVRLVEHGQEETGVSTARATTPGPPSARAVDRSADPAPHGLPRLGYEMSEPGGTHLARAIAHAFSRLPAEYLRARRCWITGTFSWPRTIGRAQIVLFGAQKGVTAGRARPCSTPGGRLEPRHEVRRALSGGFGQRGVKGLGRKAGGPARRPAYGGRRRSGDGGRFRRWRAGRCGCGIVHRPGPGLPLAFFRRSVSDDRPGGPGPEGR